MGFFAFLIVSTVGAVLLCTGIGAPIAGALGFAITGPVAGSLAAGAQAFIGNVAAGSIFAGLQAMAMAAPTP
ncbi:cuticular protein hypothetical 43 [Fennellomyces sp. T-0311]|nr:cuticular protein hypothetical 43 [Fennellomyces sp. T-0311]